MLLVIVVDDVFEDSARLPQDEVVCVGVFDGGKSSVGVDFKKRFDLGIFNGDLSSLAIAENVPDRFGAYLFVRNAELFQCNDDLERVRTLPCKLRC